MTAAVSMELGAIVVPHGWQREVDGEAVYYLSPDNRKLCSLEEVTQHLVTPGTCKCGLRCPVDVKRDFNFDPDVIPLPDHIENIPPLHMYCKKSSRPQPISSISDSESKGSRKTKEQTKKTPPKMVGTKRTMSFALLPEINLGKKLKVGQRTFKVSYSPVKSNSKPDSTDTGHSKKEQILDSKKKLLSLLKKTGSSESSPKPANILPKPSIKSPERARKVSPTSSPTTTGTTTVTRSPLTASSPSLIDSNSSPVIPYSSLQEILKQAKEKLFKQSQAAGQTQTLTEGVGGDTPTKSDTSVLLVQGANSDSGDPSNVQPVAMDSTGSDSLHSDSVDGVRDNSLLSGSGSTMDDGFSKPVVPADQEMRDIKETPDTQPLQCGSLEKSSHSLAAKHANVSVVAGAQSVSSHVPLIGADFNPSIPLSRLQPSVLSKQTGLTQIPSSQAEALPIPMEMNTSLTNSLPTTQTPQAIPAIQSLGNEEVEALMRDLMPEDVQAMDLGKFNVSFSTANAHTAGDTNQALQGFGNLFQQSPHNVDTGSGTTLTGSNEQGLNATHQRATEHTASADKLSTTIDPNSMLQHSAINQQPSLSDKSSSQMVESTQSGSKAMTEPYKTLPSSEEQCDEMDIENLLDDGEATGSANESGAKPGTEEQNEPDNLNEGLTTDGTRKDKKEPMLELLLRDFLKDKTSKSALTGKLQESVTVADSTGTVSSTEPAECVSAAIDKSTTEHAQCDPANQALVLSRENSNQNSSNISFCSSQSTEQNGLLSLLSAAQGLIDTCSSHQTTKSATVIQGTPFAEHKTTAPSDDCVNTTNEQTHTQVDTHDDTGNQDSISEGGRTELSAGKVNDTSTGQAQKESTLLPSQPPLTDNTSGNSHETNVHVADSQQGYTRGLTESESDTYFTPTGSLPSLPHTEADTTQSAHDVVCPPDKSVAVTEQCTGRPINSISTKTLSSLSSEKSSSRLPVECKQLQATDNSETEEGLGFPLDTEGIQLSLSFNNAENLLTESIDREKSKTEQGLPLPPSKNTETENKVDNLPGPLAKGSGQTESETGLLGQPPIETGQTETEREEEDFPKPPPAELDRGKSGTEADDDLPGPPSNTIVEQLPDDQASGSAIITNSAQCRSGTPYSALTGVSSPVTDGESLHSTSHCSIDSLKCATSGENGDEASTEAVLQQTSHTTQNGKPSETLNNHTDSEAATLAPNSTKDTLTTQASLQGEEDYSVYSARSRSKYRKSYPTRSKFRSPSVVSSEVKSPASVCGKRDRSISCDVKSPQSESSGMTDNVFEEEGPSTPKKRKTSRHSSTSSGGRRPRSRSLTVSIPRSSTSMPELVAQNQVMIPCQTVESLEPLVGDIVWAKASQLPAWPGRVISNKGREKPPDNQIWIRWFGDSTISHVDIASIKPLEEGISKLKGKTKKKASKKLERAIAEARAAKKKSG